MQSIDINCDMGEGVGNDSLLMPYISSCSIACGGHIGDEKSISETLLLAKKHGVKVGAHPAYPDPDNFGRKTMSIANEQLKESLEKQLFLFKKCCEQTNSNIHHIKPHGALYNDLYHDKPKVQLFLEVIKNIFPKAQLYCAPGSLLEKEAANMGVRVMPEAFMDRAYEIDGTLRSRALEGAVLKDLTQIETQVLNLVKHQTLSTFGRGLISLEPHTLCLHGDHPEALIIIQHVNLVLKSNKIDVR